jgi:hypothetical protein
MLRLLFWLLVIACLLAAFDGVIPLPGIPDEEVVYATPPPVSTCGSSGCVAVYTLELANVGRSAQSGVRVRLRPDAIAAPLVAPTVRRASDSAQVTPATDRGVDTYPLGRMEPEERIALVFALRAPSRETVAGWDRVLVGVEPAAGAARPGGVSEMTVGRAVHGAGRVTARLVAAVRKAIASS